MVCFKLTTVEDSLKEARRTIKRELVNCQVDHQWEDFKKRYPTM